MNSRVYKNKNNNWEFRITWYENGKQRNKRRSRNESGQPFKTKAETLTAAKKAEAEIFDRKNHAVQIINKTYAEVFDEYRKNGRLGKAPATCRKQDSLWVNHIKAKFGDRLVCDVSVAEINDYLAELYQSYSYQYTESFLKMFYLILGQAHDRNYLDEATYRRLCVNKTSKIKMPKRLADDNDEIKVYSKDELSRLDEYFKGRNAEIPYLIGRYTGVRINEAFGILWSDIDFAEGVINIRRQMTYINGVISLKAPKTRNAIRTIPMPRALQTKLQEHYLQIEKAKSSLSEVRTQKSFIIRDSHGIERSSLELVCTLPNGKIQTVNSMKFHRQQIEEQLGICFRFHILRHTFASRLAEANLPTHTLCKLMGHSKIETTRQYYLAMTADGFKELQEKLDLL